MSDIVAASSSTYSCPFRLFIKTDKVSTNFTKKSLSKNIFEITVTPHVSNSFQWHLISRVESFQYSLNFLQNVNFPLFKIKFPDFQELFFP